VSRRNDEISTESPASAGEIAVAAERPAAALMSKRNVILLRLLGGAALLAILGIAPFVLRPYHVELAILFLINLILVVSYRLITTTGDWSLCHVVLMGAGAYATALMAKLLGWPFWATMPLAGVAAAVIGLGLVYPLLRTKGFGFFIASFAIGEFLRLVWVKFHNPFGGPRGMINIPSASLGPLDISGPLSYYFFVLGIVMMSLWAMYRLDRSRIGNAWKAVHTDDLLAECVGIKVAKYRALAFMIGSFFAGIAGALLAHHLQAIDPKNFDINTMVYLIIWVVVGGTATFWGPIVGLVTMTVAFEATRPLLEWRPVLFGSILIFFLIFMPGGLESLFAKFAPLVRRSRGLLGDLLPTRFARILSNRRLYPR
jgi:branched-chain amino acid transport system permease protein